MKKITVLVPLFAALISASTARAQLIISEVDAAGSGNTNYAADWFELKYRLRCFEPHGLENG
jgi:hypothetical protein